MNLEEIKVNEELKKFAEKYNWELVQRILNC